MPDSQLPQRKHLQRLDRITVPGAPVFFITACVENRERVLAHPSIADIVVEAWQYAEALHGWLIGRYVIMPDHVHVFAGPARESAKDLSGFMQSWKRSTAIRIRKALLGGFSWQREFFDHLMRSDESYAQKWEYVRLNPVRAGLVGDPAEWPYQGEISSLEV